MNLGMKQLHYDEIDTQAWFLCDRTTAQFRSRMTGYDLKVPPPWGVGGWVVNPAMKTSENAVHIFRNSITNFETESKTAVNTSNV